MSSMASSPIRIAKVAVLLPFGVSAAVFAGKHAGSVLSAAAPPYVFLTVHLIIAVIWKLSDRKPHNPTKSAPSPPPPPEANSTSSDSDDSCVTADEPLVTSSKEEIGGVGGNDSMDDTWRAIVLKKADTWERTRQAEVEVEAAVMSPAAVADDEWNQRFDAFIKKSYDQIRLQTGGAYRRHVDSVNRAFQ